MRRHHVISRLCELTTRVGTEKFKSTATHDCFCSSSTLGETAVVNTEILDFIAEAIQEKLDREK